MKYYLHTINGMPAAMMGDQICYLQHHGSRAQNLLVDSLATIKAQQSATKKYRASKGYSDDLNKYGYVTVFTPRPAKRR